MDGVGKGEGQGRSDIQRDTISLITRQQLHQFNSFRWNIQSTLSQSAINFIRCSILRAFFFYLFCFFPFFFFPFWGLGNFKDPPPINWRHFQILGCIIQCRSCCFDFLLFLLLLLYFPLGGGGREGREEEVKVHAFDCRRNGHKNNTHTKKRSSRSEGLVTNVWLMAS